MGSKELGEQMRTPTHLPAEPDRLSRSLQTLQQRQKHLFVWDVSVMAVDICPVGAPGGRGGFRSKISEV